MIRPILPERECWGGGAHERRQRILSSMRAPEELATLESWWEHDREPPAAAAARGVPRPKLALRMPCERLVHNLVAADHVE